MSKDEKVHVVMLPWLAFGHMIPFLELSIALAKSGIHVSFVSTPRNIQRLPKVPQNLSSFIDLIPFHLPKLYSNSNPEDAEATIDISPDLMDNVKIACDLLKDPIKDFIAQASPNWIIVDFFHHWAVDISQELNIPVIEFHVTSASTAVFFWSPEFLAGEGRKEARPSPQYLTRPPEWVTFPSKVACKNHEAINMHKLLYGQNETGMPDGARQVRLVQGSRAVIVRTCFEFEADCLKLYTEMTGKPVIPVGFLLPEKLKERSIIEDEAWNKIFDWLDNQKPRSVLFVGFGSECELNKEQIHEISYGVELSGLPFLWALRKPDWAVDDTEVVPPGVVARTAGRGVLHVGWAPQRDILAHPSIGGSLFHAGWGSIIETLIYGHCLVVLPFIVDQPLNARLLIKKGLAVEVERDEDGSFTRHEIADAVHKAMVSEDGEKLRASAKEAAEGVFGDRKLNDEYVEKFAGYLRCGIFE